MAENYEEIVRKYYMKMRGNFIDYLMEKYKKSKMRREDAEDIYQRIFITIQENLMLGRMKENTSWNSYIMTIGLNMAAKEYRRLGKTDSTDEHDVAEDADEKQSRIAKRVEDRLTRKTLC